MSVHASNLDQSKISSFGKELIIISIYQLLQIYKSILLYDVTVCKLEVTGSHKCEDVSSLTNFVTVSLVLGIFYCYKHFWIILVEIELAFIQQAISNDGLRVHYVFGFKLSVLIR